MSISIESIIDKSYFKLTYGILDMDRSEWDLISSNINNYMDELIANGVDFILVRHKGNVKFKHYSVPSSTDDIVNHGFDPYDDRSDHLFGNGIYAFTVDDSTHLRLIEYYSNSRDELLCKFDGLWFECVEDLANDMSQGIIVIPENLHEIEVLELNRVNVGTNHL